ncbi:unnamed protein product [Cyclocybe aegerita]|uniref:DRBM domain-containing protein n=1 Tax=Cyclocybe aegerita TaxID=1973307 RepID=A0A8S0XPT1_CYCAE|nr:unnamed protein product [Cyclocybe aegerita]
MDTIVRLRKVSILTGLPWLNVLMNSVIPGAYTQGINQSVVTLKRTRSGEKDSEEKGPRFDRRPDVSPSQYGDNERLACLGETSFDLAITTALFQIRPLLPAGIISKQRKHLFKDVITVWVAHYGLVKKLRCHPDVFHTLESPEEQGSLFYAYVGGLLMTSGQEAVNTWIDGLFSQERPRIIEELGSDTVVTPPQKRAKSEAISPVPNQGAGSSIFFASQPPPSPPPVKPEPSSSRAVFVSPPPAHLPNPLAPAQPDMPFLPLFNQAAMQRRVQVDYLAEFSGPQHAPRWTVKCIVNGICKGIGSSNHKQTAKEEAARKAYYSMGWT